MLLFICICLGLLVAYFFGPVILNLIIVLTTGLFQLTVWLATLAWGLIMAVGWLCWLCVRPKAAMRALREAQAARDRRA